MKTGVYYRSGTFAFLITESLPVPLLPVLYELNHFSFSKYSLVIFSFAAKISSRSIIIPRRLGGCR